MSMVQDFVLETCNAPGTGTCNLLGAATDRVSFASVFTTGSLVFYVLDDNTQSEWGMGTFTSGSPNTIARTTVLGNTSGTTSKLNFAGLTKIYNSLPSAKTVYVDNNNNVVVPTGAHFAPVAGGTPVGAGMDYYSPYLPAGFLWCNGQAVSRTTYSALFTAIGTAFGSGDGSSTFNLPDCRGRVNAGNDAMGGAANAGRLSVVLGASSTYMGGAGGDANLHGHSHTVTVNDTTHTHTITDAGHTHATTDPGHTHPIPGYTIGSGNGLGSGSNFGYSGVASAYGATTGVSINTHTTGVSVNAAWTGINSGSTNVVGAGSSLNVQPTLICNKIIFAGV